MNDMKLIFLDTETTDVLKDARLVQLAFSLSQTINYDDYVCKIFQPPIPISFGAMGTHNITENDVRNKEFFSKSLIKEDLKKYLKKYVLVAHNAPFDIQILKNEGLETMWYIDTLQVAKHLIKSDTYRLQDLRYVLDMKIDVIPHSADGDVKMLKKLFWHLYKILEDTGKKGKEIIIAMMKLSKQPILMVEMPFGKYRGKMFSEVKLIDEKDPNFKYLNWLLQKELEKPEEEQYKDLVYTLKFYT